MYKNYYKRYDFGKVEKSPDPTRQESVQVLARIGSCFPVAKISLAIMKTSESPVRYSFTISGTPTFLDTKCCWWL